MTDTPHPQGRRIVSGYLTPAIVEAVETKDSTEGAFDRRLRLEMKIIDPARYQPLGRIDSLLGELSGATLLYLPNANPDVYLPVRFTGFADQLIYLTHTQTQTQITATPECVWAPVYSQGKLPSRRLRRSDRLTIHAIAPHDGESSIADTVNPQDLLAEALGPLSLPLDADGWLSESELQIASLSSPASTTLPDFSEVLNLVERAALLAVEVYSPNDPLWRPPLSASARPSVTTLRGALSRQRAA